MGCCGHTAEEEVERSTLFRELPDNVIVLRRVAFSALRHHERIGSNELARRSGLDLSAVRTALGWLEDAGLVEQDAHGRVIGIAGLTVEPTRHRLTLDGASFFTWCAIDAVGIPAALSLGAEVVTACGHCGAVIEVVIDHGDPPSDSPLRGWVPPTTCENVRADLCPVANLFCSPEHLEQWRSGAGNPRGELADLSMFAELGRQAWGDLAEERDDV